MPRKAKFDLQELKPFLDEKAVLYNARAFIDSDPISLPHRYSRKEDIEIMGFLAATIAWGNRKSIIQNASRIATLMDDAPFDFITQHNVTDRKRIGDFVHRTFNAIDLDYFWEALQYIYIQHGGLESIFAEGFQQGNADVAISYFKKIFFSLPHPERTRKHVSDPLQGSSAKRLNMYLRWMVRRDVYGVDFGIWKQISPSVLSIPLDVHTGNVSRKLGLLKRKQSDWKAVAELDKQLRLLDPTDPVKYDFALFGLGVFEKF